MHSAMKIAVFSVGAKCLSTDVRQVSIRGFTSTIDMNNNVVITAYKPQVMHFSNTPTHDKHDETRLHKKGKDDVAFAMGVVGSTVHKTEEFVVDVAKNAYSSGKEYAKVISDELKKDYDPNQNEGFVQRASDGVVEVAKDVYTNTRKVAKDAGDAIYESATDFAAAGAYKVVHGVAQAAAASKEYIAGAAEAVGEVLPHKSDVVHAAQDAYNSTKEFALGADEELAKGASGAAHAGKDAVADASKSAYEAGKGYAEAAVKSTTEVAVAAKEYANEKVGDAKEYANEKVGDAKEYANEKVGDAKEYAIEKVGDAKEYANEKVGDAKEYANEKVGDAKEYANEKVGDAKAASSEKKPNNFVNKSK